MSPAYGALVVLAAATVALAVRLRRVERDLDEQLMLFNGHLVAHEGLTL